jgi:hypothetical protein
VKHLLKLVDIDAVTHVINTDHVRHMVVNRYGLGSPWALRLYYLDRSQTVLLLDDAQMNRVMDRCE